MSKLNAKWLNFDTQSLQNSSENLQLHIDSTSDTIVKTAAGVKANASTVMLLSGDQTVSGVKTFNSIPVVPATNPTSDNQVVRKGYVDGLLTGLTWENPVFHADQLVSGGTGVGGIRPSAYVDFDDHTGWDAGDTIKVDWNDGSAKSVTFTAVDSATPGNDQFDINQTRILSDQDLAAELIRCVNDSTSAILAIQGVSKRSVSTSYFIADDPAVWTSFTVTVTGPASSAYRKADADGPNLGKLFASLEGNETHFARGNDNAYTWNDDDFAWIQISGVGSLPDATKTQHGVVQVSDGLAVAGGVLSIDLAATNPGLALSGTTPNKKLTAIVTSGLEITGSGIGIAADGIKDTMIDFGTGAGQVSGGDIPIVDASGYFPVNDVESALQSVGAKLGSLDANQIIAGSGLVVTVGGYVGDATTVIKVDLASSNPGLEFDGSDNLKAKVTSGLEITGNGIGIAADGVKDTMIDFGTGANQVSAVDLPIADSGDLYAATEVEAALAEVMTAVNAVEDNLIIAGSGLIVTQGGSLGDATTLIKVDLAATNPGLEFDGSDNLKVKLKTAGSILCDANGLYVDTSTISTETKQVDIVTLTGPQVAAGYFDLTQIPCHPGDVELIIGNGIQQVYDVDFTVISDGTDVKRLKWTTGGGGPSVGLVADLAASDVMMVSYSY